MPVVNQHIRTSRLQESAAASSTEPAWRSAKDQKLPLNVRVSATLLWDGWDVKAWWSDPSNCCFQLPIMCNASNTIMNRRLFFDPFLSYLFFCSSYWLPYIMCEESVYNSGEASQWILQSHFLRWLNTCWHSKAINRSVQTAALEIWEEILYFMPQSQMTSYDNAL